MAMHCSTKVLKLMCLRFCPGTTEDSGRGKPEAGASGPFGTMRGGESRRKARVGPKRVICVSLLVCSNGGRIGLCREPGSAPSDMTCGSSSSSESGGLNTGECGNSEVSNSQMDLCLRMGLRAAPFSGGEGNEDRSSAAAAPGDGLGVGSAVWRGP